VNRRIGWAAMTILASLIALNAMFVLLVPGFGPPFVARLRTIAPLALHIHIAGGLVALALGPWQMNSRLRSRNLGTHRWLGRGYVVAVFAGSIAGMTLAPTSMEGAVTHVGFGMLAVLWLLTTVQAYRRIRADDRDSHRRWMIRSFALTLAAVTLRIYLPLAAVAGIAFHDAYQMVAWLCWVPNVIIAEWIILARGVADIRPLPQSTSAVMKTLILVAATLVGVGAATPAIKIDLAHGTGREQQTKVTLEQVLAGYDLKKFTFTKHVVIEERAVNHAFPVLTLNARFAASPDELLSSFVHEQLHWHLRDRGRDQQDAIAELRRMYPNAPVGLPEGADSEVSTYGHLVDCYLEIVADRELIGPERTSAVVADKGHYTWIYATVLRDDKRISDLVDRHHLRVR
jgi:uncharacterized membrane protein